MSFQSAFCGKVEQNEYSQVFDFLTLYSSSGQYLGRELVVQHVTESTFRFHGLSASEALSGGEITITDIGGNSYTIPLERQYRDGSTGTKVLELYSATVQRTRFSPRLWDVVVRVRSSSYTVNGKPLNLPNA